jgi:nitrogenase molybdenum-iron protein NifN
MGASVNLKFFKATTLKPLHINPLKLSQPMGATLAFLGIKNCMPLMHGAQGCASFTKVLFTRHFNDPIAIQTTAVNDITAVIDGGDKGISEAVENITKKVTPDLVGLFTTGMTETKGDDIKGATLLLKEKQKMVYVHTPDFEGGLESGWSLSVQAIISQLIAPTTECKHDKVLLIPNVNLSPIEVEKLKEALELFDFDVLALPDLSDSLDNERRLTEPEILRTIAFFRYINPEADIRLGAGRALLTGDGIKAFQSGASATITGNMLTTVACATIRSDKNMLKEIGRETK